jgi:AcrR family transcriptional regulator
MSRLAPAQWTLADIARECGLTAGALVQRFGSKHGLLVALTSKFAAWIPAMFRELRAAHPSPLAALRAYADCMAQLGDTPRGFAHHLAYLQLDLTDPDLHENFLAQMRATRAQLRKLVVDGRAAGELARDTDPAALARQIEVVLTGSLMTWAFWQRGSARTWVREDLDAVLRPHLAPRRRRKPAV